MANLKILLQLKELECKRSRAVQRKNKDKIHKFRQQLDPSVLQYYDMVKERYGSSAIAEITNGACSGCNMMVPRYNLKHLDDNIYICEYCNRILYDFHEIAASEFIYT